LTEAGFSLDKPVQACPAPQKILLELSEFFPKIHESGCVCYPEAVSIFSLLLASLSKRTKQASMLQEDTFISNIKNFIKLRFLDPNFSIDFLTNEFFISHSYLCKIFKEKTGKTLISYINEQKMRNAEKLLKTTNFSVYEIAYMSGFNSYPHFLTIFKKLHNVTATEYRKSIKE
jgi:YesN/AraC family two-component response regulator